MRKLYGIIELEVERSKVQMMIKDMVSFYLLCCLVGLSYRILRMYSLAAKLGHTAPLRPIEIEHAKGM